MAKVWSFFFEFISFYACFWGNTQIPIDGTWIATLVLSNWPSLKGKLFFFLL